jgi:Ohr subfamily peroxiredoxin
MGLEEVLYETEVVSSGAGRNGHVRSNDGLLDFDVTSPRELGGKGGHTNPEQLFGAAYAACFHSSLLYQAQLNKIKFDRASTVTAQVAIGPRAGADGWGLGVKLIVDLPGLEQQEADHLVQLAHDGCPYSKAVRGNVDVSIETNVS